MIRTGILNLLLISFLLAASGCSGLTQMQDGLVKFDQGAHTIDSNEIAFMKQLQQQDCDRQFFAAAYTYAVLGGSVPDLLASCTPGAPTNDTLARRQRALDAVALYADKLQALGSAGDDKTLATNAQTLAQNINSAAKTAGLKETDSSAEIEAAIVGLTDMVLDHEKFAKVKDAAAKMQPSIDSLVTALKAENKDLDSLIDGNIGSIQVDIDAAIVKSRQNRGAAALFDITMARQQLNNESRQHMEDTLNASLDALSNANHAIATTGEGGVVAAVTDLVARAQAAQALQATLAK